MDFNGTVIETDRLILKVLDYSYAERVLDYYIRNREFLKRWEPIRGEDFYTPDYHENEIRDELDKMNNDRMFKVWIFKKSDALYEHVIGYISFSNFVRGCFQSCHAGYKMDKDEINNGYMTEALKGAIDFVFNRLKLHRIEANIIPENKPSLRLVEKLGFNNEGLSKKYLKINGKWEDHIHMVILNEEME